MQINNGKIKSIIFGLILSASALLVAVPAGAQDMTAFHNWAQRFKPKALARGIDAGRYDEIMGGLTPDFDVIEQDRSQPESKEQVWQYLSRRVSDWRVREGRAKVAQNAALLASVERQYGVDSNIVAAIWGLESSYGGLVDNPKYMRPVLASLATLAFAEPRRRLYWEQELLNALVIVQRGWARPADMKGSWAGAMGHTQWMPEVWLNMGTDFNKDGKISPFGAPDDALGSTARFLQNRGNYVPHMGWGFEVKAGSTFNFALANNRTQRTLRDWQQLGLTNADGSAFENPNVAVRVAFPAGPRGPGFALTQNFRAVMAYNPSFKYALAVCLLADRLKGGNGLVATWPGATAQLSVEELSELQQRLTRAGFDTGGSDGRVGSDTNRAITAYQLKRGLKPADGFAGPVVLQALRGEK